MSTTEQLRKRDGKNLLSEDRLVHLVGGRKLGFILRIRDFETWRVSKFSVLVMARFQISINGLTRLGSELNKHVFIVFSITPF